MKYIAAKAAPNQGFWTNCAAITIAMLQLHLFSWEVHIRNKFDQWIIHCLGQMHALACILRVWCWVKKMIMSFHELV